MTKNGRVNNPELKTLEILASATADMETCKAARIGSDELVALKPFV